MHYSKTYKKVLNVMKVQDQILELLFAETPEVHYINYFQLNNRPDSYIWEVSKSWSVINNEKSNIKNIS